MKKINNKGFAVSTVLYGLVIVVFMVITTLMAILQSNRSNTHNLVDKIEKELNDFGETTVDYKIISKNVAGDISQEYTVTQDGWYKIELWGASGGDTSAGLGGLGAYTSGIIKLTKNDKLYFNVGGKGVSAQNTSDSFAGLNGGGKAIFNSPQEECTGGGGATDVRIFTNDTNDRIMVAAGGGGTCDTYDPINGGDGGTISGLAGQKYNMIDGIAASAGTQKQGGNGGYSNLFVDAANMVNTSLDNLKGSIALGGPSQEINPLLFLITDDLKKGKNSNHGAGGGAGYYGGGASLIRGYYTSYFDCNTSSGGGGSSYISGYAGVIDNKTNKTIHNSNKYFKDGIMIPGLNKGHGKAKIKLISRDEKLNKTNTKLSNVQYIKDCISGSTTNVSNHWTEIQAISDGTNVAKDKKLIGDADPCPYTHHCDSNTLTNGVVLENIDNNVGNNLLYYDKGPTSGEEQRCVTIDLNQEYNLDEIAVWHYYLDGRSYKNNILTVAGADGNFNRIIKGDQNVINNSPVGLISMRETVNGNRYSAWQIDSTDSLPEGNYYIFSAANPKYVLNKNSSGFGFQLFNGEKDQIWIIKKTPDSKYNIIENTGKNYMNELTIKSDQYNWSIEAVGNNTYYIKNADAKHLGFLFPTTGDVPTGLTLYNNKKGDSTDNKIADLSTEFIFVKAY